MFCEALEVCWQNIREQTRPWSPRNTPDRSKKSCGEVFYFPIKRFPKLWTSDGALFNSLSGNGNYDTANRPRHGRTRGALTRVAAKRPIVTLDELQRSTARVEAFMEAWQQESHFYKKTVKCPVCSCQKSCGGHSKHVEESALVRWDQSWTFWPKCKMLFMAKTQRRTSLWTHHPHCQTRWW